MAEDRSLRVLGIDPGLRVTGYGVLDIAGLNQILVTEAGVIRSTPVPSRKPPLSERLEILYTGILEVLEQLQPAEVAIEELYSHYAHPRTAILMGHARGVILLAAGLKKIPVTSYSATMIKRRITGSGHASKSQMQTAMQRELRLPTLPEPPDVADALAAALCHAFARRSLLVP